MEFVSASEETTDDITVHGDIEAYFDDTRDLYNQAVAILENRYNNRENWLEKPVYPDLDTDIPDAIVEGFVESYVIHPAFDTLSVIFNPDITLDEFAEQEETPFNETERYIYLKHTSEETPRYEWADERTVIINPYFKIKLPISKSFMSSLYAAYIKFERTEDTIETSLSFALEGQTATEGISEACFTKLCSDRSPAEREASFLADCGVGVILVALGHKPVATTKRPRHLKQVTEFPIDTICWDADANEECEVTDKTVPYADKKPFVFNTETHSRTEIKTALTQVYESSENQTSKFGQLLGYPEYATKSFERRLENDIAPATDNYIKQLFYLLGTGCSFNKKELDYATYTEYVYDYDNLSKDAKRGQQHKAALINFMETYNIETANPDRFNIQKKYPEEVPATFDAFWTYE